ncbi:RNA-binding domain-containing protein [Paenibacillus sp. FSL L8-0470]|uniref:RNA-binding domain-containing protein n=1 Tax=Paenibacillus sp. FSL L8-0470 TaxID=2954688 RepID=UPI0030FC5154
MIDRHTISTLLGSTSFKNLVGVGMELKPYELALLMLRALDNSEEYGYIVMGVSKLINNYAVVGLSLTVKDSAKEPISTALSLISVELEVEYDNIDVNGRNVFVIKLKNSPKAPSMNFTRDLDSQEGFIKNLIVACLTLQARNYYSNASEDERNDYIGDMLAAIGYSIKDQTRRGSSSSGKGSGELDIFVSKDRLPFTVIEAMNLSSLSTNYINEHLDKIFSYDTSGNKFNVCLSYVKIADFNSFWERYSAHVTNHSYPAPLLSSDTSIDDEYGYSELRIMKTNHNRSSRTVSLYHICVKIH